MIKALVVQKGPMRDLGLLAVKRREDVDQQEEVRLHPRDWR